MANRPVFGQIFLKLAEMKVKTQSRNEVGETSKLAKVLPNGQSSMKLAGDCEIWPPTSLPLTVVAISLLETAPI